VILYIHLCGAFWWLRVYFSLKNEVLLRLLAMGHWVDLSYRVALEDVFSLKLSVFLTVLFVGRAVWGFKNHRNSYHRFAVTTAVAVPLLYLLTFGFFVVGFDLSYGGFGEFEPWAVEIGNWLVGATGWVYGMAVSAELVLAEMVARQISAGSTPDPPSERIEGQFSDSGNPLGEQFDVFIDGLEVELKAVELKAPESENAITNSVGESIKAGGQAREISLDVRGTGTTQEQAQRGAARSLGTDQAKRKLDGLTVIGDDFDFRWTPRK
jgi:hypothetical protein